MLGTPFPNIVFIKVLHGHTNDRFCTTAHERNNERDHRGSYHYLTPERTELLMDMGDDGVCDAKLLFAKVFTELVVIIVECLQ